MNNKLFIRSWVFLLAFLLVECNAAKTVIENTGVINSGSLPEFPGLISGPEPISTTFSDAQPDNSLPANLGAKWKPKILYKQPMAPDGSYILTEGLYEMTSKSYCLHAGTYGPSKGDGYLFAPLKGARKDIIQALVRNSKNKKAIPQATVQLLIWAVLAKSSFKNLSANLKSAAVQLLTPQQLFDLNGGALGLVPASALAKATDKLPEVVRQAAYLENKMRQLFANANSTYQDLEKVAVLAGRAPAAKEFSAGAWSKHPGGYYVRYFPSGYTTTKVQVYVPKSMNTGFNGANGYVIYASLSPSQTAKYDGTANVAVPANTKAQRLQQSNDPVPDKNTDTPPRETPKLNLCEYPPGGLNKLPESQQAERREAAQQLQNATRLAGVKPNVTPFDTMDGAGLYAINYINGTSIKEKIEYAGQIYLNPADGKYYFSEPVGRDAISSKTGDSVVPAGMTVVGDYHTHGGQFKYSDEIFSPPPDEGDVLRAFAQNDGRAHYLGTPQGRVEKMVIPKDWQSGPSKNLGLCDFITQLK